MPGLINDPAYEAAKRRLCTEHQNAARAFDAVEWALLDPDAVTDCEIVGDVEGEPVRAYALPATPTSPRLIVVFIEEDFEGTRKLLLLDATVTSEDEG